MAGTAVLYRVLQPHAVAKAKKDNLDDAEAVAESAFDKGSQVDLAKLLLELPPEQAAYYLAKLEAAYKKRRLQLSGYVVALVSWLVAMLMALAYYGANDGFTGWVFLIPFLIVGLVIWGFGRWAEVVGKSVGPPPEGMKPAPGKSKAKSTTKV